MDDQAFFASRRSALPRAGLCLALAAAVGCQGAAPAGTAAVAQPLRSTPGGVDITTYGFDTQRTSWNRRETALTTDNVRPETFGRIASADDVYEVPGSALFASAIPVMDARAGRMVTADTVFVGTMTNGVFALDADDLGIMWRFDFEGRRSAWADELQACQSHYHIGVMSTPVLSPDRTLLYVVGRVATSAATRDTWLQGYALRTRDGSVAARFRVGETVGADGTTRTPLSVDTLERGRALRLTFATHQYTQRSALLLVNNTLYVSTGGICDTPGFRGWLMAFDVTRLSERTPPTAIYVPAPGGGGGMWAAGGAASDGRSVFVALGNGRADLRADTPPTLRSVADALVRLGPDLSFDPRACFNVASATAACGPADAANLRNVFMPRNAELLARESIPDPMATNGDIFSPDEDFGSSGPLLVPAATLPENMGVDDGRNLAALGGKDGFFFLVDRDRMGGVGPSQLHTEADIARLVGPELYGRELYLHSTSGGIRANAAYFEGHSGRYLYVIGADEIGGRADSPRGVAALRLARVTDPTPAACAAQFRGSAYHNAQLPCATIWGATSRPGYELAWSGTGPVHGAAPFVSSNGNANGIVWVTHESNGNGRGLLQAWAAEAGAGTGRVVGPLYRSDRVPNDRMPYGTSFAGPIVANGRVYVTGETVSVYGVLPRRTLPPLAEPTPPPNCPPGVTWEADGRPFMNRYCTTCHAEYQDLGFIQRRGARVAQSILPSDGSRPSMPLQRTGMTVPVPTTAERTQMAAWLRCGAPPATTRLHAGYEDIAAPGAPFTGDVDAIDPSRQGALSADRLMGAPVSNRYAPEVPDAVFAADRTGPSRYRVPVPGLGRYAVSLYFAENACLGDASACRQPFDVAVAGSPWLAGFDIASAAGGARRVVARRIAVDLPATSQLVIDVGDRGKLHALEVTRVAPCTATAPCPRGFVCTSGACVAGPADPPVTDAGVVTTDAAAPVDASAADVPTGSDAAATDAIESDAIEGDASTEADASATDAPTEADASAKTDAAGDDAAADGAPPVPGVVVPPNTGASDGGCAVPPGPSPRGGALALGALAAAFALRRRGRRAAE